jgi:uncharacterized membrane protein
MAKKSSSGKKSSGKGSSKKSSGKSSSKKGSGKNSGKKGTGKGSGNRRVNKKKSAEELKKAEREERIIKGAVAFFIIAVLIAIIVRFAGPPSTDGGTTAKSTLYDIIGNELVIPVADVTTSAQFYSYETGGKDVVFFAVEGSDGQIHTAFDACDVCYQEKKGYYQDGSQMVCRNCGQRFSTNEIGTTNQGGGCWPGYMQRLVDGSNVKIQLSELDRGRGYFP